MRLTLPQIALLHACKFVLKPDENISPLEQYNMLRVFYFKGGLAANVVSMRFEYEKLTIDHVLKTIDELTALFIEFNKNTTEYEKLI